ncbi:hypothetical protein AALP_AA7G114000 [Arabis alpina]|uniref:Uncharacterized protein n=1 Tax=Arabis alpina TaxID=50452 RepID=A0A087GHD6_ARAAL|nr:hypothetical protein AALP_AA7G114000 [Arabis alpina]
MQTEIVEITPDLRESKKRRKRPEQEEEEGTPLRGIFCLKTRQDMKIFEEKEDCFILDFDPNDSSDATKLSFSDYPETDNDDVQIIREKGQVACRDYPHSRHLCSKFPFRSTPHATHCNQCYCYVCDLAAPCAHWTSRVTPHCEALEDPTWNTLREVYRKIPSPLE